MHVDQRNGSTSESGMLVRMAEYPGTFQQDREDSSPSSGSRAEGTCLFNTKHVSQDLLFVVCVRLKHGLFPGLPF